MLTLQIGDTANEQVVFSGRTEHQTENVTLFQSVEQCRKI